MPLPSSGAISLGNNVGDTTTTSVNREIGRASPWRQSVNLNQENVRLLLDASATGAVSFDSAWGKSRKYSVFMGVTSSPYICGYKFNYTNGWGSRHLAPGYIAGAWGQGVAVSPDNTAVAVATQYGERIYAFQITVRDGFTGVKYAAPASPPGGNIGYGCAFSRDGTALALTSDGGGQGAIQAWQWSTGGFGSKFSAPAGMPTGYGYGIDFHPNNDAVVAGYYYSPYVVAFRWSSSGFGTKYSDPATIPPGGQGHGAMFSPSGDYVAITFYTSPYIHVYPWTSASGFGAKVSNPATLPPDGGYLPTFSPDGNSLVTGSRVSPWLTAWQWSSSGFGAAYSNPTTMPTGIVWQAVFTADSKAIILITSSSPWAMAYQWSPTSGFGAKYTDPSFPITSGSNYPNTAALAG